MNCILFGLGPHAKRIYIPYFENSNDINTVIVVDFKSEEDRLKKITSHLSKKYEFILLDNYIRNFTVLPYDYEAIIKRYIDDYNVSKAIVSTEPRSHKMYINFSLKYGLDIMCDKPITAPLYTNTEQGYKAITSDFNDLMNQWKQSDTKFLEIQTQRRAHVGYKYIWELVNNVVTEYKVPINKMTISHSDGNWNMPSEVIYRENHPYKYGYGKMMHNGYHFIDLLAWFVEINKENGFNESKKDYKVSTYRPSDFYSYYGKEFNERLKFLDKEEFYENLEVIKNFGELDISALIDYKDEKDNIICTAILDLSQSGISQRSWYELPEDTYKGNGRIRHEMFNITVGPLLNIKVLSFQSTEVANNDIYEDQVGGLNHFEILVFKNSKILGGKPFERIMLSDIEATSAESFYLGQNESPRFEILNDFMKGKKSHSSIAKHRDSIEILSNIYKEISNQSEHVDFRFAVEGIIECNNKVLLCKRQDDLKIAPGIWNVPAGKVQFNEGLEDAIIREIKEETRLEVNNITYLDYHFINEKHKRLVFTYHTIVTDEENVEIDKNEFSEYRWVKVNDIEKYHTLNKHLVKWIRKILGDKDE